MSLEQMLQMLQEVLLIIGHVTILHNYNETKTSPVLGNPFVYILQTLTQIIKITNKINYQLPKQHTHKEVTTVYLNQTNNS